MTSTLIVWGVLGAWGAWMWWEGRRRRELQALRARQHRDLEVMVVAAVNGQAGLMRLLADDLRQIKVRRVFDDVLAEGGDVADMLARLR